MENLFEALETLLKAKQICDVSCIEMCNNCQKHSAYDTINQALTELKHIKEIKPDETMDYLERIKNRLFERFKSEDFSEDFIKDYEEFFFEPIKQALQRLATIDDAITICKKANEQKYVYIKETYDKESYGIVKEEFLDDLDYEVLKDRLYVNSRGIYYDLPLKDYGNWWALTKEELENE